MKSATDANGRVEFNLGNQGSTAGVHITNVKVVRVKKISTKEVKTVRPDGNYVYNGEFQEGADRLNYWTVKKAKGATVKVTNSNNVRQLKAVVPASVKKASDVTVKQTKIAIKGGKSYVFSFDAKRTGAKDQTLTVKIAGKTYKAKLTGSMKTYKFELKPTKGTKNATLEFQLGTKGTTYIDNVRIMENGLIINGDFSAGMTGFEAWANNPSDVSYVVDTVKEDSAFSMDIKDTGDQDWHVQLKQTGIKLEKGQNYKITFKAKASVDRDIKFAFQRNGLKRKTADGSEDWTVYFEDGQIPVTKKWQTYSAVFEMAEDTDADTSMSFSLGAVGGKQIKDKHTVLIDDIVLEKTDEKPEEDDDSLIINGHFTKGLSPFETWAHDSAKMESGVDKDKVFTATISNTGTEDWHAQLKQVNIPLEKGQYYTFSFRAKSDLDRNIKYAFQKDGNKHNDDWTVYFEESNIAVTKDWKTYTTVFKMEKDSDKESSFSFNLGAVGKQIKDKHTVMIDDVTLRVATEEEKKEAKKNEASPGGGNPPTDPGPGPEPDLSKPNQADSAMKADAWDANDTNISVIENTGKLEMRNSSDSEEKKVTSNTVIDTTGISKLKAAVTLSGTGSVQFGLKKKTTTFGLRSFRLRDTDDEINLGNKISLSETETTYSFNVDVPGSDSYELFVKIAANTEMKMSKIEVSDANMIYNDGSKWVLSSDSKEGGAATKTPSDDGTVVIDVTNPGDIDYAVKLTHPLQPEVGKKYRVKYDIESKNTAGDAVIRNISVNLMDGDSKWFATVAPTLESDGTASVDISTKVVTESDKFSCITFSLGKFTTWENGQAVSFEETDPSRITIKNLSIEEIVSNPPTISGDNMLSNPTFENGGEEWTANMITKDGEQSSGVVGEWQFSNGEAKAIVTNLNSDLGKNWTIALKKEGLTLNKGCKYEVKATLTSTTQRKVEFSSMDSANQKWYVEGDNKIQLEKDVPKTVTFTVSVGDNNTDTSAYIGFNLGKQVESDTPGTIAIKDISMVKISGTVSTPGGDEGENTPGDKPDTTPIESNGIIFKGSHEINNWETMWAIPNVDWTQVETGAKIVVTADMIEGQGYASFHVVDGAQIANQLLPGQGWDYERGGTQTKTIAITQEMLDVAKSTGLAIQGWGFTIKRLSWEKDVFEGSHEINNWETMWAIPNVDWTQVEAGAKIVVTADMIEGQGYASFNVVDGAKIDNKLLSDQGWDYASGGTQTKTIEITQEMLDVAKSTGLSIQGWGFTIKKVALVY